ncbi:hypothetical protein B0H17DRAFT_1260181 [Mycena rosella]|uniref:Uncharacterized protein n=1 Tax=Mycena rosella TaxID=1033263 RepID=A0AAD7DUU4_MYCRO|nr:hypothetical protein B0H17DRAFT_1260181 [Mycena rosella]
MPRNAKRRRWILKETGCPAACIAKRSGASTGLSGTSTRPPAALSACHGVMHAPLEQHDGCYAHAGGRQAACVSQRIALDTSEAMSSWEAQGGGIGHRRRERRSGDVEVVSDPRWGRVQGRGMVVGGKKVYCGGRTSENEKGRELPKLTWKHLLNKEMLSHELKGETSKTVKRCISCPTNLLALTRRPGQTMRHVSMLRGATVAESTGSSSRGASAWSPRSNKDIRIFFDDTCLRTNSIPFSYRLSELQSLAPVGHDVAIYINLLNPHVDQLDDLAHGAAWQARAEAPANSLIEVDVDTDTDPRDLDPDKLDLYDSFDTNDARSLVRNRSGPEGDAATYTFLMFSWRVLHRQQERRYELQERARILALDRAIAGQRSTVEVELLYVNHALAYHLRKAPPGRTMCRRKEQKHAGLLLDERGPVAPVFVDYCFSKELGAAGETAPACQRTSSAQSSHVGTSQASPGPRSRSPVETRPRDADFPDGNQNCAPGHKPSQEPPGIVSRPSVETRRHQADFHYGYQNVYQDPKTFDLKNAAFRWYWPLRSPLHVGVCFLKCARAMPSFLVAIRVEHKANKSLPLPLGIRLTKPVPTGVNAADAHQRCSWNITHQPRENCLIKGLSTSHLRWYGACQK